MSIAAQLWHTPEHRRRPLSRTFLAISQISPMTPTEIRFELTCFTVNLLPIFLISRNQISFTLEYSRNRDTSIYQSRQYRFQRLLTFKSELSPMIHVGVNANDKKCDNGNQNHTCVNTNRPTTVAMCVCPARDCSEMVTFRPPSE